MLSSLNARLKFALIVILALAFGAAFLWLWFGWLDKMDKPQDLNLSIEMPTGTLMLSYALMDQEKDTASLFSALLDLSSDEAEMIEIDDNGTQLSGLQYVLSPNGEWVAFIDWFPRQGLNDSLVGWPDHVYRAYIKTNDWMETIADVAAVTEPIASSTLPTFPDVSNQGEVLYMSAPYSDMEASDFFANAGVENWNIVRVDAEGNEEVLTHGSHPQWLDEDNFLFLKSMGIYRYTLSDGTETLVIPSLSPLAPSSRLEIDQTGHQALLIEPSANAVRLFTIERVDDGITLRERSPIMEAASSAEFSPDGRHVALILVPDQTATDTPLVIYDFEGIRVKEISLLQTSWAYTSIQAWVR